MALTDLTNLKLYLGISVSTYDTILTEIMNAVSAAIETECDRDFSQANHTEFRLYTSDYGENFKVQNHPITLVYGAAYGSVEMVELDFNAGDTTFYQVFIDTTRLTVSAEDGDTTSSYTLTTYDDIEALFDAIVGDYATFTVTWRDDWYKQLPPFYLIPDTLNTIENTQPDKRSFYGVNNPLHLFADGKRMFRIRNTPRIPENTPIVVRYQAGYSTIPLDLEMMCKKLCQGVWERSGQGSAVTEAANREKIGKYEVEKRTGASVTGATGSRSIKGLVNGLLSADILYDLDKWKNKDLA